jgi:hypothetical protein
VAKTRPHALCTQAGTPHSSLRNAGVNLQPKIDRRNHIRKAGHGHSGMEQRPVASLVEKFRASFVGRAQRLTIRDRDQRFSAKPLKGFGSRVSDQIA